MKEYSDSACEICGCSDAEFIEDPYQREMRGEQVMRWLCSRCYEDQRLSV